MAILGLVGWLGDAAAGCAVVGAIALAGRMIGAHGASQPALRPVRIRVRR